jgi:hypothetical protein
MPVAVTTDAIARASTIRASVATIPAMCAWTALSYRAAPNERSFWIGITATRSMARRAAHSPLRARFGHDIELMKRYYSEDAW